MFFCICCLIIDFYYVSVIFRDFFKFNFVVFMSSVNLMLVDMNIFFMWMVGVSQCFFRIWYWVYESVCFVGMVKRYVWVVYFKV